MDSTDSGARRPGHATGLAERSGAVDEPLFPTWSPVFAGTVDEPARRASTTGGALQARREDGDSIPERESDGRRRGIQVLACFALLVSLGYLIWRLTSTLGGTTLWLSIPLLLLEAHAFVSLALYTHDLWDVDVRPDPSRDLAPDEQQDVDALAVAVLIPTYNEPHAILLPTIAAALATNRPHETWVLDDGDRAWVRELAEGLGAHYRSRHHGSHGKAGNINEALADVGADLVAVVDADHAVTEGFLDAVLPYFADPRVAVVQTPQDFYNETSFEHAARADGEIFAEEDMFYRGILAGRNRWGSAFWCGTGALVRVAALESVGGVATDSVTEDIQTTLRMHRQGWRTVHHNEVVAHGLAADDARSFYIQRERWGAGAMQVLRRDNPAFGPGLTRHQRLSYLSTLLGWFDSWRTIGYVLLPVATLLSGGLPVSANAAVFLVAFLSSFIVQRFALSNLSRGRAPLLLATYFEFIRLPAAAAATMSIVGSGPSAFAVTPKGSTDERARRETPALLNVLLALSVAGLVWYAATLAGLTPMHYELSWVAHGSAAWLLVNAGFIVAARRRIRAARFTGDRRDAWRFQLDGTPVEVELPDGAIRSGVLADLSVNGASIWLADGEGHNLPAQLPIVLHLSAPDAAGEITLMAVAGTIRTVAPDAGRGGVRVGVLLDLDLEQQRRLALALYRPRSDDPPSAPQLGRHLVSALG